MATFICYHNCYEDGILENTSLCVETFALSNISCLFPPINVSEFSGLRSCHLNDACLLVFMNRKSMKMLNSHSALHMAIVVHMGNCVDISMRCCMKARYL